MSLKKDVLIKSAFVVFLLWIPFGTKKFVHSFVPGGVSELTSVFLYASDLLLILFLGLLFWLRFGPAPGAVSGQKVSEGGTVSLSQKRLRFLSFLSLVLFLLFAALSVFFAGFKILAIYQFVHLSLGVFLTLAVAYLLKKGFFKAEIIFFVIAVSALFQALVAFAQFKFQHSLGLYFLGESPASPFVKGVSEVEIAGGRLMRTYGTMPHANILAAFLVLGILAFTYFYLNASKGIARIGAAIGIFFTGTSLIFTFSRSGWLTAAFAAALLVSWGFANKNYRLRAANLAAVLAVCLSLFIITMGWAIFPRAKLAIDNSINDRLIYNQMSLRIIGSHPLGVGIGNEMLFAETSGLFRAFGLTTASRWQPIHNLYLLIASEIGISGLVFFLIFILGIVLLALRNRSLEAGVALAMLAALLFGGMSDHFLWDLQSGRLMLWLAVGIVLASAFIHNKNR